MDLAQIGYWVACGLGDVVILIGLGKLLFKDLDGFFEAVVFLFKPDLWSALSGEFWEDWWAEAKLGLFFTICGGIGFYEYRLFLSLFGQTQ